MQKRRRFVQTELLEERLAKKADRLRQQAETGAHMSEWLRSPGSQHAK